MPTYEYRCPEGHEFERFQKMTEPPRAKCPVCGRAASRKISGGAGLIFNGSGFYITDYGKDGKGPRVEKDSEAKPETPAAKSEASAAKPEPAAKDGKAEPESKSQPSEKREKKSPKKKASS
jgi:putative FmdB family regulatory protein